MLVFATLWRLFVKPDIQVRARRSFLLSGLGAIVAGLWVALTLGGHASAVLLAVAVPTIHAALALPQAHAHAHDRLGPAHWVTLARSIPVAALAACIPASEVPPVLISMLAGITMILDGVDGLVARRTGLASPFGAAVDAELDAVLMASLTGVLYANGHTGPWVLLAGAARFVYIGAGRVWPWLNAPLAPSLHRKLCFGVAAWSLVAAPMLDGQGAQALGVVGTSTILASFGLDILWLFKNRT